LLLRGPRLSGGEAMARGRSVALPLALLGAAAAALLLSWGPAFAALHGAATAAGAAGAAQLAARKGAADIRRQPRTALAAKKGGGKKGGGKKGGGKAAAAADDGEEDAEEEEQIDVNALLREWQASFEKPAEKLREALVGIRAGKATPQLVDSLKVSAYGSEVMIKEVATITATDALSLTVACFDAENAPAVEKAIKTSDLGYSAVVNGANVRIGIPELTKEKRAQYVKLAKDTAEKSKVVVRNSRQTVMKKIKGFKSLTDDESRALAQSVEDMVKKQISELDSIYKKKEDELSKL